MKNETGVKFWVNWKMKNRCCIVDSIEKWKIRCHIFESIESKNLSVTLLKLIQKQELVKNLIEIFCITQDIKFVLALLAVLVVFFFLSLDNSFSSNNFLYFVQIVSNNISFIFEEIYWITIIWKQGFDHNIFELNCISKKNQFFN